MDLGPHRRFISVKDAALYLGMDYHNLYEKIGRNEIPCVRVGRCLRVDLKALEEDFQEQLKAYKRKSR